MPSDKEEEVKPKTASEQLREAVSSVAGTPAGKALLKYLHDHCGFRHSDSRWNPQTGEINVNAIVHNAAIRNVYVDLRKHIPKEFLLEIEH